MIRPQRFATLAGVTLATFASSPTAAVAIVCGLLSAGLAYNARAEPSRPRLVTDGGTDLESPMFADEWPTECSNPDWSDTCNGDLETKRERKKGLCEGCMAVIRSWSDDDDDDQDDGTEQATLVTDGGTDDVYANFEQTDEQKRRDERYDELVEQINRAWGERALAVYWQGDPAEYYAELESHQLVQAWPDFLDEPVLKALHHQSLINEVRLELEQDSRELKVVEWDQTPFPADRKEWGLV